MKIFLLMLIVVTGLEPCWGQPPDSTTVSIVWGTGDDVLNEIILFKALDYYTVRFPDNNVKGKVLHFKVREFLEGMETRMSDIYKEMTFKGSLTVPETDKEFVFKVLCDKSNPDSVSFGVNLPSAGIRRKFKSVRTKLAYSLRDATTLVGKRGRVPLGKFFPLFVYSLPYANPKTPGLLTYCGLTYGNVLPERWGEVYQVKHYIVWELAIMEP